MKTKIEIKSIWGKLLFEYEKEDNTVSETLLEALRSGVNLSEANLSEANLGEANLSEANLSGANLGGADLSGANLSGANLRRANLSGANLRRANLGGADLRGANLSGANLSVANLIEANLSGANLGGADLSGANPSEANPSECTAFLLPQCPSGGAFIAWKKAGDLIVKLQITEDAKRSSATTLKCRCSKAKILAIENKDGSKANVDFVLSDYNYAPKIKYAAGETVEVPDFNENRWIECSAGIHFFIAREMAVHY